MSTPVRTHQNRVCVKDKKHQDSTNPTTYLFLMERISAIAHIVWVDSSAMRNEALNSISHDSSSETKNWAKIIKRGKHFWHRFQIIIYWWPVDSINIGVVMRKLVCGIDVLIERSNETRSLHEKGFETGISYGKSIVCYY